MATSLEDSLFQFTAAKALDVQNLYYECYSRRFTRTPLASSKTEDGLKTIRIENICFEIAQVNLEA